MNDSVISIRAKIARIATRCRTLRYFVYLLVSGARSYVGWTTDLDKRLTLHNTGKGARSTRGRHWVLAYAERHTTRRSAMSREWHLKRERAFRKEIRVSVGES